MSNKHAYLIMAYNNWNQLRMLLKLLDDERNDIYLHIDKKAKNPPINMLKDSVNKSHFTVIDSHNVYWADYSQVEVELRLLEAASNSNHYKYYHLLSGMDLPLKTQDEIHDFFDSHNCEFIAMTPNGGSYSEKHICYYHPLVHNRYYRKHKVLKGIDRCIMYIQRILHLKRVYADNLRISTGWQWFSITDDFCRYVLSEEPFIKKMFSYTLDADEKFMGTMVNKLGIHDRLYYVTKPGEGNDTFQYACQRMINFDCPVPQPYTWGREDEEKDFEELMNCGYMFARKFDENVNKDIIGKIVKHISDKKEN